MSGLWTADVERPGRPGLTVEVAGRGSIALRQNGTAVLLAQVDGDHCGVEYAATGAFRSPVPPVRAAQAARFGTADPGGAWHGRWAHHFAAALTRSAAGPLHAGRWVISAGASHLRDLEPTEGWDELVLPGGRGYIDWFRDNGSWQILPLRPATWRRSTPSTASPGRGRCVVAPSGGGSWAGRSWAAPGERTLAQRAAAGADGRSRRTIVVAPAVAVCRGIGSRPWTC